MAFKRYEGIDDPNAIFRQQAKKKEHYIPYVTILLIAINVIVFVVLEIMGDTTNANFMLQYGAVYPDNILSGEYWRYLTAMFLHFGFLHIINNMVMLYCAGLVMEKAMGRICFLLLYLFSGTAGFRLSCYMMLRGGEAHYAVSAGASGAVFGLIGGLLWVVIRNKGRYEGMSGKAVVVMIALSVYSGIVSEGVDNWGHVGGLIMGFLLSIILYGIRRRSIAFKE